jgi:hypothetical protein
MRETVRSLRIYLVLTGTLSILLHLAALASGNALSAAGVLQLVGAVAAGGLFYVGLRLPQLLAENFGRALAVVHLNMGFIALVLILSLAGGAPGLGLGQLVVGLVILLYIRTNLRRLSVEASVTAQPSAA